jgi:hypothetical protein
MKRNKKSISAKGQKWEKSNKQARYEQIDVKIVKRKWTVKCNEENVKWNTV